MNPWWYWLSGIAVMAVVTYIPRALPLSLMRRKVESPFWQSFLYYMPVTVLGALLMALWGRGLLPTALVAAGVALATEAVMVWAGAPLFV